MGVAKSTLAGLAIAAAFACLWAPLGQEAFLHAHWMKVGTFMAPFLVFAALTFRADDAGAMARDAKLIALGLLVLYIAHQFEEHWIDVFGTPYAFQESVNGLVRAVTGAPSDRPGPLSVEAIFVINTSLVWLVGVLAVWRAPGHVFPTLAMAAIVLVNAVAHIASGLASFSYNPGLLTSVVLFLPGALLAYRALGASRRLVILSLAWAVLAHVIMVAGMMASTWWGVIAPEAYFAALIIWSIVPVFVTERGGQRA